MTFYKQASRIMGLRTYFIIALVVFAGVMAAVGNDFMQRFIRTCDEPPTYHADVPQDVRDQIDALYEQELLYCSDRLSGLQHMSDRVYWATDGVSSLLFFQADDLSDLGVVRYGFGKSAADAFVPVTTGAAPIPGMREDIVGRSALSNQAPEGSSYYYRMQGAPADDDNLVAVTIRGTAMPQPGITGRDAFRDVDIVWNRITGAAGEVGDTGVKVNLPILSELWEGAARRDVNPDLADEDGRLSAATIREAALAEPTFLQTVSGPLGTTVWIAGVVSGTNPSLVLTPQGAAEGAAEGASLSPIAQSAWESPVSEDRLEHFAFEPLPSGAAYEARYWHDARDAAARQPDFTWPVTVP